MSEIREHEPGVALHEPPAEHHEGRDAGHRCVLHVSYNGERKELHIELSMTAQTVLQKAIHEFQITQNPHLLSLFTEDGRELVDGQTLGAQHVKCGEKLLLRPGAVKGGWVFHCKW